MSKIKPPPSHSLPICNTTPPIQWSPVGPQSLFPPCRHRILWVLVCQCHAHLLLDIPFHQYHQAMATSPVLLLATLLGLPQGQDMAHMPRMGIDIKCSLMCAYVRQYLLLINMFYQICFMQCHQLFLIDTPENCDISVFV